MDPKKFRLVALLLAVVLPFGLAACGDDDTGDTTTTTAGSGSATEDGDSALPEGYEKVDKSADGFTVAVPSEWTTLDPGSEEFERVVDELIRENESLRTQADQVRQAASQGMKLFVLDQDDPATNVNIIVSRAPAGAKVADLRDTAVEQLRQLGDDTVETEEGKLGGEDALRAIAEVTVKLSDQTVTAETVQYYVINEGRLFIITTYASDAAAEETIGQLLDSIRFT